MGPFLTRGRRTAMTLLLCGLTLGGAACSDDNEDNGGNVGPDGSPSLPTFERVQFVLDSVQNLGETPPPLNGGFGLEMWATVVDRSGIVRVVAFSGPSEDAQWPASRVISAQKANTANSLSLDGLALSTANLYSAVQPGGSLFGLQESNPVNTEAAYGGNADEYGTTSDFMLGKRIGGVNVFGGGLALYDATGAVIGAIGVSGDSSCAVRITSSSISTAPPRAAGATPPARPMRRQDHDRSGASDQRPGARATRVLKRTRRRTGNHPARRCAFLPALSQSQSSSPPQSQSSPPAATTRAAAPAGRSTQPAPD
jgi:uncharacterized protein GlcG (DUF336 family)